MPSQAGRVPAGMFHARVSFRGLLLLCSSCNTRMGMGMEASLLARATWMTGCTLSSLHATRLQHVFTPFLPASHILFIYLFLVHLVEELVGGDLFLVYPREGELGSPGKVTLPPPRRWQLLAWLTLPQSPPEHPQDNRGLPRVGYQ